jgi:hypothetical protein
MSQEIVWYHIENNEIFTSAYVDSMFYALQPLQWNKIIALGVL